MNSLLSKFESNDEVLDLCFIMQLKFDILWFGILKQETMLFTSEEICEILIMSSDTLLRYLERGEMGFQVVNEKLRISAIDLFNFLDRFGIYYYHDIEEEKYHEDS